MGRDDSEDMNLDLVRFYQWFKRTLTRGRLTDLSRVGITTFSSNYAFNKFKLE